MLYADVNVLIDETSKSGNKSLNHGEALQSDGYSRRRSKTETCTASLANYAKSKVEVRLDRMTI